MNKETTEFFKLTEEWFTGIPDKTESGLRALLRGERPADAGTSITQKVSNKSALLIYNYDLEAVHYKLRSKFSESAIFDREELKYLIETFDLDEFQAEAVRFANLLILRNEYVKDCIEIFKEFIIVTLSHTFKTIERDGIPNALKKFRSASSKTKNTLVEGIGLSYVERLKQSAYLFIKTPNVGRPADMEDKTEKITSAIKQLLKESFGSINESNINNILDGKIIAPRITRIKVADQLEISRPQLNKWLSKSKLDFKEQINQVQDEFYQELKKQWSLG